MGNLPAMEVDATRIRGTGANIEIRYVFGALYILQTRGVTQTF